MPPVSTRPSVAAGTVVVDTKAISASKKSLSSDAVAALHARLAGFSRLLACAVNESLLYAHTVGVSGCGGSDVASDGIAAWCLVTKPASSVAQQAHDGAYLVGLSHAPIRIADKTNGASSTRVAYLHPADISAVVFRVAASRAAFFLRIDRSAPVGVVPDELDALQLFDYLASTSDVSADTVSQLKRELASSAAHATFAFQHPAPTPDIASAAAIAWEQCIVQGHATHPMHKARCTMPPLAAIEATLADTESLRCTRIVLVALSRDEAITSGKYQAFLDRICQQQIPCDDNSVLIPVHPRQVPNIRAMFPAARIIDGISIPAIAQASIRTVFPTDQHPRQVSINGIDATETVTIKLAIGVKVTSALRTITPKTCYQGPRLVNILNKLEKMVPRNELVIWHEAASVYTKHEDEGVAKHLSCIFRSERVPHGERVIMAAALTERHPGDEHSMSRCAAAFGLATLEDRVRFLDVYTRGLFRAFFPALLQAGFAFEAHPQNVLLRVRPASNSNGVDSPSESIRLSRDWELAGFAVRDFGGIMVHPATLYDALGETLDVLPEACTIAETKAKIYKHAYHTMIYCHLQALVRALDLHYSGVGWQIVRRAFRDHCPEDHEYHHWVRRAWVDMKSFMRMKLDGLYRDYIYDPAPNILLYRGEDWVCEHGWWPLDAVAEHFQ